MLTILRAAAGRRFKLGGLAADRNTARSIRRVHLAGAAIDLCTEEDSLRVLENALSGHSGVGQLRVGSVNLDHIHHFGVNGPVDQQVIGRGEGWLMLVDGMPPLWAARRATGLAYPRLAGSDLLPGYLSIAAGEGKTVGFLGGTQLTKDRLAAVLGQTYPDLRVVGHWIPGRDVVLDSAASAVLAEDIAIAGVDLLVVGLGKPRQELWIERHGAATGAKAVLAFGASAEFLAGTVDRAPSWIRDSGLEWLFRLGREPRRLGRRYLVQGPRALRLMLSEVSTASTTSGIDARPTTVPASATELDWELSTGSTTTGNLGTTP